MFAFACDFNFHSEQEQYEARKEYLEHEKELDRRYEHMMRMAHDQESPEVVE
jgi:hypothetical protein